MITFPPMDFSRFKWRPSPNDPKLFIRETMGAETFLDFLCRFNSAELNLFIGVDVDVKNVLPTSNSEQLISKARAAWAWLRYQVPTIASHLAYDADGRPLMTYKIAGSSPEVDVWVENTFRVRNDDIDLDDLRYELGRNPLPEKSGDQTFLYFVIRESNFGLLLHTHHTPFDGAGIKVIMAKFLTRLATSLNEITAPVLDWGNEAQNLEPAAALILRDDEVKDGSIYQQTLGEILTTLSENDTRAHGFKNATVGFGFTRRVEYKFDAAESATLLQAANAKGFTINHIAHAALSMVAAEDNPLTEDMSPDATLLYFGVVNSRYRLAEPFKSERGYAGLCLSMSPVVIPMLAFKGVKKFDNHDILTKTAKLIKKQYQWQKACPALLAVVAQEVDLMLAPMLEAAAQAEKTGQQFSPPPWTGPWYTGDGIVESYLPRHYHNSTNENVLEVVGVFVSLNKVDPGPFFRMYSFNEELILSADHNEKAMASEIVKAHMDTWARYIRLILA